MADGRSIRHVADVLPGHSWPCVLALSLFCWPVADRTRRSSDRRPFAGVCRHSAAGISGRADRRAAREGRRAGAAGPRPAHLRAHAAADSRAGPAAIFFKIDMPFETCSWRRCGRQPRLTVVDATAGIQKRMMDAPCCRDAGHDHDHPAGDGGEPDPHVWLSPPLLKIQAENIAAALCQADPAPSATTISETLTALLERLDALRSSVSGGCWRRIAAGRSTSFIPASAISPTPTA